MGEKNQNEIIEEQRRARREFLELRKREQEGIAPEKREEIPLTGKEKAKNFFYYNKWFILGFTALAAVIAVMVAQCANRVSYDFGVVLFSYHYVPDAAADLLGEQIEAVSEDVNEDGEVHVQIVNCTFENNGSDSQYTNTILTKVQAILAADQDKLIFLLDEQSCAYFSDSIDLEELFIEEPYVFSEEQLAGLAEKGIDLPQGTRMAMRRVNGAMIEKKKGVKEIFDASQRVYEQLKSIE